MRLVLLGTGSSSGTPSIEAGWGACDPLNPMNRRLRPSVLVEHGGYRLLVDTSPDLRGQLLSASVDRLDAVLLTHAHADHLHGIDDLRPLNRLSGAPLDLYAAEDVLAAVRERFGYVLTPLPPGRTFYFKPVLVPRAVVAGQGFRVGGIDVMPFAQDHGVCLTMGYRFGPIAYSTDVVALSEEAFRTLEGVSVWVVGVLSEKPHATHAHVDLALEWIARVAPERAILTGMGAGLDHEILRRRLPSGVEPGYDGMVIDAP